MGEKRISRALWLLSFFVLYQTTSSLPFTGDKIFLTAVGDVMLGRNVASRYHGRIRVDEIIEIVKSGDVILGNLEACFGGNASPVLDKAANLKAPDEALATLKGIGFTVVSLANNHCMDFGADAVSHTVALIESKGIKSVGGYSTHGRAIPLILKVKAVTVGILAYSAHVKTPADTPAGYSGIAPLSSQYVSEDIAALRSHVDVLIASVHWGQEYSRRPTSQQILMAHEMVDAGADIVWGHHPHVLQGIENYRGKLIAYSLGNFIFDQTGARTTQSAILQCGIRSGRIFMARVIPVMVDRYLPRLAKVEEARAILNHVRELSNQLTADADPTAWRISWDDAKQTVVSMK